MDNTNYQNQNERKFLRGLGLFLILPLIVTFFLGWSLFGLLNSSGYREENIIQYIMFYISFFPVYIAWFVIMLFFLNIKRLGKLIKYILSTLGIFIILITVGILTNSDKSWGSLMLIILGILMIIILTIMSIIISVLTILKPKKQIIIIWIIVGVLFFLNIIQYIRIFSIYI